MPAALMARNPTRWLLSFCEGILQQEVIGMRVSSLTLFLQGVWVDGSEVILKVLVWVLGYAPRSHSEQSVVSDVCRVHIERM